MNDSDLNRLRSLLSTADRLDQGKMRTQDGSGTDTTDENLKLYRQKSGQILTGLTDQRLVESYQRTDGAPGDLYVAALLAEIERRNLGI